MTLDNYHVIELIGEGSFGKVRSLRLEPGRHQGLFVEETWHVNRFETGRLPRQAAIKQLFVALFCAHGWVGDRSRSLLGFAQPVRMDWFWQGPESWLHYVLQVYKGRRKCTGQTTAMKFILKQVRRVLTPGLPEQLHLVPTGVPAAKSEAGD